MENQMKMYDGKVIIATYIVEFDKESGITTWMYIPEEKKEKDMEETNLQHYKEDFEKILTLNYNNPRGLIKLIREKFGCQIELKSGELPTTAILEWMLQPYKEQILGEAEREYLSSVIKPYKNKVTCITKVKDEYKENMRYIRITVRSVGTEYINLPWFKENTMYKGMKDLKDYTLEELGL